jgi:hypothetical protein
MKPQTRISRLVKKGWTLAAIADELGVRPLTVKRWRDGGISPRKAKTVVAVLGKLLKRKRIPKQRRYKRHICSQKQVGVEGEQTEQRCRYCGGPLKGVPFGNHVRLVCNNTQCLLYREGQGNRPRNFVRTEEAAPAEPEKKRRR